MRLVIKATCDHCNMKLGKLQLEACVNSAISQIKNGEIDDQFRNLVCPKHPASALLYSLYLGSSQIEQWTKRIEHTNIQPPPI